MEADLLSALAELLLGYVMSEGDCQAGEALVQHLTQVGWASPLSERGRECIAKHADRNSGHARGTG